MRRDKVDIAGVVTLRHNSRLHHIGLGRGLTGTRVLILVADLQVWVLTEDGEQVRELVAAKTTHITRGTTYDNADHLAPAFLDRVVARYEGTRLGRQELHAEVLEDFPGAFWTRSVIDEARVPKAPELTRIVVGIDPATTSGEDSDETGLCVAGRGADGDFYVLSGQGYRLSPNGWATRAMDTFDAFHADRLIAERNNGGEMVEATLRQVRPTAPVTTIHASRGKTVRAEPIAALYEQGRVHHVGTHADLEDQMSRFPVAADLDDRIDALVYALTELSEQGPPAAGGSTEPEPTLQELARLRLPRAAGRLFRYE